jgi:hypothetical protein
MVEKLHRLREERSEEILLDISRIAYFHVILFHFILAADFDADVHFITARLEYHGSLVAILLFHALCTTVDFGSDQLYSLVVGVALLFGIEIIPAVIGSIKKKRAERKQFEDETQQALTDGLQRRRDREAARQSMDNRSLMHRGLDIGDMEMGSFGIGNVEIGDDELDAPSEFATSE